MITLNSNNLSIEYESCGKFYTNDNWVHPNRIINSYEIILVEEGTVYIQEDSISYTLKPGDLLILSPKKNHFGTLETNIKISFYWVHFTVSDYSLLNLNSNLFNLSNPYKITNLFKQMIHSSYSPEYPKEYSNLLTIQLLMELQIIENKQNNSFRPLLKEIAEYIRINSDKMLTVYDISEHFQYNEDYLSKLFKTTYGITIKEYMINQKIERAKYYLLNTNYTIKQIAIILNFNESNTFIKYFKYHESITPTNFRNLYFNTHLNRS